MSKSKELSIYNNIKNRIFTIRSMQVMIDRDLAELYGVETKILNQAVKRNNDRFPSDFMFQLTKEELNNWRAQIVTSNNDKIGLRRQPYAFSEQGVSMLSAVLRSKTAIDISVTIIRAFFEMKRFMTINAGVFQRLDMVQQKQILSDKNFTKIFDVLEDKNIKPKQGIFYDGQIFDAYVFVTDLIRSATKSIVLIDNYIDESVLQLFSKSNKKVSITIYTKNFTKILKQDLKKYNSQYSPITIKEFSKAHDRFLIIDKKLFIILEQVLKIWVKNGLLFLK